MGSCFSFLDGPDGPQEDVYSPLFFHPYAKGSQITMDESHCIASRRDTFMDGIVFSSRPVQVDEKVMLKIWRDEAQWAGGLRVGFTRKDPSRIEPSQLPPFVCPNLVEQGKTWACLLPDKCIAEGTTVSFWVESNGCVFCSVNHEPEYVLLLGNVPVTAPLWAVVDVYGRTKTVQLLDPSNPPTDVENLWFFLLNLDEQSRSSCQDFCNFLEDSSGEEECVICFGSTASTMMLPCHHATFCHKCSLEILRTSGRCPLCRQEVKDLLPVPARTKEERPEIWLKEAKNIHPPR